MSNNPFVVTNNTNEDIGENYGIITESTIKTRTEEKTNLSSCENPKITGLNNVDRTGALRT